jgi:hypothetical protein
MTHKIGPSIVLHADQYAYLAHPTMTMLPNGDWLVAFNHSRRSVKIMHPTDDPLFRTLMCRSRDRGQTWEAPWFAPDFDWSGTECPGLACLADGTVIMTEFKYAWYPLGEAKKRKAAGQRIAINTYRQEWKLDFDESDWDRTVNPWARGVDGLYAHLSFDGGVTFEETVKIDCRPFDVGYSRTGVIELADGRLAYALAEAHDPLPDGIPFLVCSADKGRSWLTPTPILAKPVRRFCEPDIVEVAPGEILCLLRDSEEHRLYASRSCDGGASWSSPVATTIDGMPGHVIKLADGRLFCCYGRRKAPFGIRAALSHDGGQTWDSANEIVLRDDLPNGDLGYPTAVEYEPGRLFVCYYGRNKDDLTCIQGTYVDLG